MEDNLSQPNIKTIRLIYSLHDAAEKEVIKEFFRFVGCLVYDMPIRSQNVFDNLVLEDPWHDVDIILNLYDYSPLWKSTSRTKRVFLTYHLEKQKGTREYIWKNPKEKENTAATKKKLNQQIFEHLIKNIWDDEKFSTQKESLLEINKLYQANDLLVYLQLKRTFKVVNMPEIEGRSSKSNKISITNQVVDNFISKMMNHLWNVYESFSEKRWEKLQSVYSIYARVNAARKIREIFKLLDEVPHGLCSKVVAIDAKELLHELKRLQDMDSRYYSMFFLSAYICQSDPTLNLQAGKFYETVLKNIATIGGISEFEAFVVYHLGAYSEKQWRDFDDAFHNFSKAAQLDPECYQARFKLGCHKVRQNRYVEAIEDFSRVIDILSPQSVSEWKAIPLKRLQYIYKSYIWMADIAEQYLGSLEKASYYLSHAAVVAEAYTRNDCIQKMLDEDDIKDVNKYHFESVPVGFLWNLLMRRANVLGNANLKNDISSRIDRLEKERLQ